MSQVRAKVRLRATKVIGLRCAVGVVLLMSCASPLGAADLEYQVKAAYLYNFLRFIDWPSQAFRTGDGGYDLCILGRDPFGEELTPVSSKTAQNRPIRLRRLGGGNDLRSCHLVFIGQSEAARVSRILLQLRGSNVLTVSDLPGFAVQGGVIGFAMERGKVRLEVNLESAHRAGLRISSKLLEVASAVYPP